MVFGGVGSGVASSQENKKPKNMTNADGLSACSPSAHPSECSACSPPLILSNTCYGRHRSSTRIFSILHMCLNIFTTDGTRHTLTDFLNLLSLLSPTLHSPPLLLPPSPPDLPLPFPKAQTRNSHPPPIAIFTSILCSS